VDIQHKRAAWTQRIAHVPDYLPILIGALDVPKGRPHRDDAIERLRTREPTHILTDELGMQSAGLGPGTCDLEVPSRPVDADDVVATARQFERVPADAATQIEHTRFVTKTKP
jgi:hypothetical protein